MDTVCPLHHPPLASQLSCRQSRYHGDTEPGEAPPRHGNVPWHRLGASCEQGQCQGANIVEYVQTTSLGMQAMLVFCIHSDRKGGGLQIRSFSLGHYSQVGVW